MTMPSFSDDLAWRARAGFLGSWYVHDALFTGIIVAADEDDARALLVEAVTSAGLHPDGEPYALVPIGLGQPHAIVVPHHGWSVAE